MIGIKDTLELNAKHHGPSDRIADHIFGITKGLRGTESRRPASTPEAAPLRIYTRSSIFSMPGGIGHAFSRTPQGSTRRHAA